MGRASAVDAAAAAAAGRSVVCGPFWLVFTVSPLTVGIVRAWHVLRVARKTICAIYATHDADKILDFLTERAQN
ncbi:hypothetical protein FRIGORI9N_470012 [Frigoribacterium sp. 9N]|nr:hypothetical protein FRIGORI9N_470012 [Frigoribacterium sp. 9N]